MKEITARSLKWEVMQRLREEGLFLVRGAQWVSVRRELARGAPRAELVASGLVVVERAS